MVDLVDAISRGIEARYTFLDPSFSEPIVYRAITRWEHEQAHANALSDCKNNRIVKLLVGMGWKQDVDDDGMTIEEYKELRMYQFDVLLWISYFGLRDFQSPSFSIETLKKSYVDVRALSVEIINVSIARQDEIVATLKTPGGVSLARIVHRLMIPLTNEAWKLTPLQLEYTILSRNYLDNPQPKGVQVTADQMEQDPEKYKKQLKEMFSGSGRRNSS